MKKTKKRGKIKNLIINTSPQIRISELIEKYASDYINMGDNTEERQSFLNGACTAWNIALLPEDMREEALRRSIAEYKRINPGVDDAGSFAHDLKILVQKKLQMFPEVKKLIVGAMVVPISETKYRITVASTDNPEQLKQILTKASI